MGNLELSTILFVIALVCMTGIAIYALYTGKETGKEGTALVQSLLWNLQGIQAAERAYESLPESVQDVGQWLTEWALKHAKDTETTLDDALAKVLAEITDGEPVTAADISAMPEPEDPEKPLPGVP